MAKLIRSKEWCYRHFTGHNTLYKIFVGLSELWLDQAVYENVTDPALLRKLLIDNCGSNQRRKALIALRHARNCTEHGKLKSDVIKKALDGACFLKEQLLQDPNSAHILEQINILLEDEQVQLL